MDFLEEEEKSIKTHWGPAYCCQAGVKRQKKSSWQGPRRRDFFLVPRKLGEMRDDVIEKRKMFFFWPQDTKETRREFDVKLGHD